MQRLQVKILITVAMAFTAAVGVVVPSVALATIHQPLHAHLLVPGKSIGPVYLGERESAVHIGPSVTNGPGSVFYRDYSITVAYKHGRAVALAISNQAIDPAARVTPYQYQTYTHPNISIGNAMGHVRARYPQAQCAHHTISVTPSLQTENCLLRGSHGHTFFAGGAEEAGRTIFVDAILVTVAAAGPKAP